MAPAVREAKLKLQANFHLLAFPTLKLYKSFCLAKAQTSVDKTFQVDESSPFSETIFADLLRIPSKILFIGHIDEFVYAADKYCSNTLTGVNTNKVWFDYTKETYTCINDIESASTAVQALEIMIGYKCQHVMVFNKITVSTHCQEDGS